MEEKLHEPAKISTTQGARPSWLRAGVQTGGLAEEVRSSERPEAEGKALGAKGKAQGQTQKAQGPWEELLGEKRWAAQGQTQQVQGRWEASRALLPSRHRGLGILTR